MKTIILPNQQRVLVDDKDFEYLAKVNWHSKKSGKTFYARTKVNNKWLLMHRLLLKPAPNMEVDHVNGDGLDNRRENIRICTHSENAKNLGISKKNTSGYKGVSWNKLGKKWMAKIDIEYNQIYLGLYADKEEAKRVYDNAAKYYFGKFSRL